MKHFIYLAAIMIITTVAPRQLRAQDEILPKHEFTINAFGGLSTLLYSIDNAEHKMGLGFGGGFGYHYFFNDRLGFVTGLEATLYQASVSAIQMESGQLFNGGSPNWNIKHYMLFQPKEEQRVWMLQLPIMVQWMVPLGQPTNKHFYVGLGGRLGYALSGNFHQLTSAVKGRTLDELNPDLSAYTGVENNFRGYDHKGSFKCSSFNAMASAELGIRWKLGETTALYTGVYADYGFLNIIPDKSLQALGMPITTGTGESVVPNSILEAHRPDYVIGVSTLPQAVQNSNRYTDKMNTLAAGLKIKFAFGIKKKKAPEPTVIPPPPPAPEPVKEVPAPAPAPAPEPVKEVPAPAPAPKPAPAPDYSAERAKLESPINGYEVSQVNLSKAQQILLDEKVAILKQHPEWTIRITGHTCDLGTVEVNKKIGLARAETAKKYLISKGIDAKRIISVEGKRDTIWVGDPNDKSEANRKLNRRSMVICEVCK